MNKKGNLHWGGSVLIPIGEESVRLRVLPKSDSIFEQDETVTLEVIDATNKTIHYRTGAGTGTVTILQAPEFNSDAEPEFLPHTRPTEVNADHYQGYIKRDAKAGDSVSTVRLTKAFSKRGATHYFASGNQTSSMLYLNANNTLNLTSTLTNTPLFTIDAESGIIRAAQDFEDIPALNISALPSFSIRAVSDACEDQYDNASVKVDYALIDLDADNDNNGYINNPSNNGVRAGDEEAMEEYVGKPITYIDQTTGVPQDYYYVPLRVSRDPSATTATRFSFDYEGSVQVYKSKNSAHPLEEGEVYDIASLKGEYYARALGTNSGDVILRLHNAAGNVIAEDAVFFDVQNNALAQDWIVPSGWKIDGGSLTTFMPVEDAVGPQDEGSYYKDNPLQKRGTVFSKDTYEDGFTMEFEYSFERNGDNGYLQPDTKNPKERIDGDDTKKVSFVGNSGIKLGGYWGRFATSTKGGITEVAIIDMPSMVACVGGVNDFKTKIDDNNGKVTFPSGTNSKEEYDEEHISQLLNGVVYGDDNLKNNIVGASGQSYREIFEQNYNLFSGNGAKMKVEYSGAPLGILSVYVWKNGAYMKYYEKSGVSITGDGRDERVYLQSHWGSGVTFSNITIHQ